MKNTEIWIGRFDVKPREGNDVLGEAKGAIVNVVALAASGDDFIQVVKVAMNDNEFDIICFADVARLADWTKKNRLDQELESLANGLTAEFPIQFDEFQSYLRDDG
jgi:hypothetical protein